MFGRSALFLVKLARIFGVLGRVLRGITMRLIQLGLEIALLFIVRSLVCGIRCRRGCHAGGFIKLVLTLFFVVGGLIGFFVGLVLRRIRGILRHTYGGILIALLGMGHALLFIERQLIQTNFGLLFAHRIAGVTQTMIDEECRVAIMLCDIVTILVFSRTSIELALPRGEFGTVVDQGIAAGSCRACGRSRG